jgi:hypothetical protein
VLSRDNGIDLLPCPNELRRRFYAAYRDSDEMRAASAFFCAHAFAPVVQRVG